MNNGRGGYRKENFKIIFVWQVGEQLVLVGVGGWIYIIGREGEDEREERRREGIEYIGGKVRIYKVYIDYVKM